MSPVCRASACCGVAMLAALAGRPTSAAAQNDPRLTAAVREAQEGHGDSARAAVRQLLSATAPRDPLYSELLYTTALTASDATERERALQRVIVEYPVSPWADDALLLLAQSTYAGGNLPGATRHLERLRSDFPASPLLARAAVWAARTYFETRNQPAACRWIALGLARQPDRETRDQLTFQAQRCGALPEIPPAPAAVAGASSGRVDSVATDTTRQTTSMAGVPMQAAPVPAAPIPPVPMPTSAVRSADSVHAEPARSIPPAVRSFRVQIAAAATQADADGIVRALRSKGIESDVTAEKGYFKVRTGQFAAAPEAQREAARLRTRLGGAPFVVRP